VHGKAAQGVQDPCFHNARVADSMLKDKTSNSFVEIMWRIGPFDEMAFCK
jgi:hypothetical protein